MIQEELLLSDKYYQMTWSMKMKFILIFFVAIMGVSSCISWKEQNYRDFTRAVLNKEDIYYFEILFVQTERKGTLGYIDAFNLRREFLNGKKYKKYNLDSLLYKILDGEYKFKCEDLAIDCFELSDSISHSYAQQSFKSFLSCFTHYNKNRQEYVVEHELSEDKKLTVIYYLYLNGYYAKYDDYDNRYFVTKGIKKPVFEEVKLEYLKGEK